MESFNENFKVVDGLIRQTSYGVVDKEKDVVINVSVGYRAEDDYGWFELYDEKSGGDKWYAEGGLWFNGLELVDYDGVFELSSFIADFLHKKGFDVEDMR
tara:strand:- start:381 stop:680 length:300 start_codon:yes stop_codon:yes gene_type:complete